MGKKVSRKANAAERQIKLALFVCEQGPVTRRQIQENLVEYAADSAADEIEVKRADATIRKRLERDRAALAEAGIHIQLEERDMYRIALIDDASSNDVFNQLAPGSPQAALLRVAGTALLQDPAYLQAASLRMALTKLSGPLEIPDSLYWTEEDSLEALRDVGNAGEGTRNKIQSALSNSKTLNFEYVNAAGRTSQRSVEPIGVYVFKGREYLAAWDTENEGPRSFRLDRMKRLSVHENGRGKPDFQPRSFTPKDWQLLPFQVGLSSTVEATVHIAPSALWQAKNLCAGFGNLVTDEIGRISWHVTCSDPQKLAAWCIANGPGLLPVLPEEAVNAYKQLAADASKWMEDTALDLTEPSQTAEDDYLEPITRDGFSTELADFAQQLIKTHSITSESSGTAGSSALSDNDILFAMLSLLEEAGAVSIPQTAQLLNVDELTVYKALETLAFCYDSAANTRINLGEFGCAYAVLEHPVGLHPSLTPSEASALAIAAAQFTASEIAETVTAACGEETKKPLEISYWKEGEIAPQKRIVEPQNMVTREGFSYLQAWCRKAEATRLFRTDRITDVRMLPRDEQIAITKPKSKPEKPQKAFVGMAVGASVPDWPGISKSKKLPADNTVTFSVPWYGGPWLPKHLASLGANVVRIEPPKLANATGTYAQSLLKQLEEQNEQIF